MLTRRSFLAAAALAPAGARAVRPADSLAVTAAASGRRYGTAAGSYQLRDSEFVQTLGQEANILVPEYELKRLIVEPRPGQFDYSGADALLEFADAHGIAMRGHTLVWYAANPPWLDDKVRAAADDEILTDYVARLVGRYRGRIRSWDVVNEAIDPAHGRADGLRGSIWLERFGPGYIDLAFHTAKLADPDALLVYNDWGCEGGEAWNDGFRAATIKFLESAKARGVPIEGLGLQGHLDAFGAPVDQRKLRVFLDEVRGMGMRILVTEHDVDDSGGPADIAARDRAVADASRRFLDVMLDNEATIAVLTWGLTDRYLKRAGGMRAMLTGYEPRKLPLDRDLKRKPMWYSVSQALRGARGALTKAG